MRRRAMSHNAKRLPRRLREMHMNQLKKSGLPPKQKIPSRKHRRRPRNLTADYERRRRRIKWLETHIWHAKRFHMVEKWGWRLGDRPCDKAFKACYRASAKHCLLQDISYFCCVEIKGPREVLVAKFKLMSETCVGLSVGAKAFIRGNREGRTILFEPHTKRAIGTVFFHWKPTSGDDKNVLWIWLHPAFYSEALGVLVDVFEVTTNNVENELENKTFENQLVRIRELKFELNRFQLSGPLSQAILRDSLKIADPNCSSEWFKSYLNNDSNRQSFANQINHWKSLDCITNPAELSPHTIISLIVSDPRFNFPSKRTKVTNTTQDTSSYKNNSSDLSDIFVSPIWNQSIREQVRESKISNATIAEMRSQLLVPGSELDEPGVPIPLLLIQRPGSTDERLGYSAGWDVIIPANWAQAFWMAFIMRGARAGGLRETISMDFEMGTPDFLTPDTLAGNEEELNTAEMCKERFFKIPPNKRTNYNKYAIVSPFNFNWKLLVGEWIGKKVDAVRVLRDRKLLNEIRELLTRKTTTKNSGFDFQFDYIVPVKLKIQHKGCPKQFSIICLPKAGDLEREPIEPQCEDVNQMKRKQLRREHKKLLQTLKKRRKRAKNQGKVSIK